VTADAKKSSQDFPYFESVELTCPDGQLETIDIAAQEIADRNVIRQRLPNFCRKNCDNVYFKTNTRF
jgi:hypothetical protein